MTCAISFSRATDMDGCGFCLIFGIDIFTPACLRGQVEKGR